MPSEQIYPSECKYLIAMPKFASGFRQLTDALRYLVSGDVSGLFKRLKRYRCEYSRKRSLRTTCVLA